MTLSTTAVEYHRHIIIPILVILATHSYLEKWSSTAWYNTHETQQHRLTTQTDPSRLVILHNQLYTYINIHPYNHSHDHSHKHIATTIHLTTHMTTYTHYPPASTTTHMTDRLHTCINNHPHGYLPSTHTTIHLITHMTTYTPTTTTHVTTHMTTHLRLVTPHGLLHSLYRLYASSGVRRRRRGVSEPTM